MSQQATLVKRIKENMDLLKSPFYSFVPRPDRPELFDQQTSWMNSKAMVACCVAGNRSGKTHSAAIKVVRLITIDVEPPFKESYFIVLSDTFDQVTKICWKEKLEKMIPSELVDWDKCLWHNKARGYPFEIVMKPWPNGHRWVIEFRSCDQKRRNFQGRAYCGLWVSEQAPWEVIEEVRRGFVDYPIPGSCFLEFTPLDPDLTVGLEEKMEQHASGKLPDWEFFHLNSELNTHINQEYWKKYLNQVSPEIRETRRIGKLASFAGAVYPNWNMALNVVNERRWREITGKLPPERYKDLKTFKQQTPPNVFFRRGVDFGESLEHYFACVFGWKNSNGDWFVWDEYLDNTDIMYDHRIHEIKDRYPWPEEDPHFGLTYCDYADPGYIAMMGRMGINCSAAVKRREAGYETIRRLIPPQPRLNSLGVMEHIPRLIVLRGDPEDPDKPGCPNLIRQMWKLRYMRSVKPGVPDNRVNKKKAPNEEQDWDNDAAAACRYMIHSDTPYDGKSAPKFESTVESPSRYGLRIQGNMKDRRG